MWSTVCKIASHYISSKYCSLFGWRTFWHVISEAHLSNSSPILDASLHLCSWQVKMSAMSLKKKRPYLVIITLLFPDLFRHISIYTCGGGEVLVQGLILTGTIVNCPYISHFLEHTAHLMWNFRISVCIKKMKYWFKILCSPHRWNYFDCCKNQQCFFQGHGTQIQSDLWCGVSCPRQYQTRRHCHPQTGWPMYQTPNTEDCQLCDKDPTSAESYNPELWHYLTGISFKGMSCCNSVSL